MIVSPDIVWLSFINFLIDLWWLYKCTQILIYLTHTHSFEGLLLIFIYKGFIFNSLSSSTSDFCFLKAFPSIFYNSVFSVSHTLNSPVLMGYELYWTFQEELLKHDMDFILSCQRDKMCMQINSSTF